MSVENFAYPARVIAAFQRTWERLREAGDRANADDLNLLHHHKLMIKHKCNEDDHSEFDEDEWVFEFNNTAHQLAAHLGIAL